MKRCLIRPTPTMNPRAAKQEPICLSARCSEMRTTTYKDQPVGRKGQGVVVCSVLEGRGWDDIRRLLGELGGGVREDGRERLEGLCE